MPITADLITPDDLEPIKEQLAEIADAVDALEAHLAGAAGGLDPGPPAAPVDEQAPTPATTPPDPPASSPPAPVDAPGGIPQSGVTQVFIDGDGPATFGVFFKRGDVPGTLDLDQVNIKRRWDDGSLKHAVITTTRKGWVPMVAAPVAGPSLGLSPNAVLAAAPLVEIHFLRHGGGKAISALSRAEYIHTWLSGPLVTECVYRDVPSSADEAMEPDEDMDVFYHVRVYAGGDVRVRVVVENCKWTTAGNLAYDVEIRVDGATAFQQAEMGAWPAKPYIGHPAFARWSHVIWKGRNLDENHVVYDVPYILSTGLLPRYDPATNAGQIAAVDYLPLRPGLITPYFPQTGGRDDIGPLPEWTVNYLLSQSPEAKRTMLAQAEAAAGCPVHYRDHATGEYLDINLHPRFSLNARQTREAIPTRASDEPWVLPARSYFTPDGAHQASFAYVPYLITGDFYYLEEMEFWAAYNAIRPGWEYRQGAKGLLVEQERGHAWTIRNLAHVAAVSPSPDYFETILENNLAKYQSEVDSAPPIGIWKTQGNAITRGWPADSSRYQCKAFWQHGMFACILAHVYDLGYGEALPVAKQMIGTMVAATQGPKPELVAAYYFLCAEKIDGIWSFPATWDGVCALNFDREFQVDFKVSHAVDGEYGDIAAAAFAEGVRLGVPGAREAYDWLTSQQTGTDIKWAFSPLPAP